MGATNGVFWSPSAADIRLTYMAETPILRKSESAKWRKRGFSDLVFKTCLTVFQSAILRRFGGRNRRVLRKFSCGNRKPLRKRVQNKMGKMAALRTKTPGEIGGTFR